MSNEAGPPIEQLRDGCSEVLEKLTQFYPHDGREKGCPVCRKIAQANKAIIQFLSLPLVDRG